MKARHLIFFKDPKQVSRQGKQNAYAQAIPYFECHIKEGFRIFVWKVIATHSFEPEFRQGTASSLSEAVDACNAVVKEAYDLWKRDKDFLESIE